VQYVADECNRSPGVFDPNRSGVDKLLRVLKYMVMNDTRSGETRRMLLGMAQLRNIVEFFTHYKDDCGKEARSFLGELERAA
jgi:sulfite reductase alpha subunit-like flavoprotein